MHLRARGLTRKELGRYGAYWEGGRAGVRNRREKRGPCESAEISHVPPLMPSSLPFPKSSAVGRSQLFLETDGCTEAGILAAGPAASYPQQEPKAPWGRAAPRLPRKWAHTGWPCTCAGFHAKKEKEQAGQSAELLDSVRGFGNTPQPSW